MPGPSARGRSNRPPTAHRFAGLGFDARGQVGRGPAHRAGHVDQRQGLEGVPGDVVQGARDNGGVVVTWSGGRGAAAEQGGQHSKAGLDQPRCVGIGFTVEVAERSREFIAVRLGGPQHRACALPHRHEQGA